MNPPTVKEFNSWNHRERREWINLETAGSYKEFSKEKGYFPMIIYEQLNAAIVYQVDRKGNLTETAAMTIGEAIGRLRQFEVAYKATASSN